MCNTFFLFVESTISQRKKNSEKKSWQLKKTNKFCFFLVASAKCCFKRFQFSQQKRSHSLKLWYLWKNEKRKRRAFLTVQTKHASKFSVSSNILISGLWEYYLFFSVTLLKYHTFQGMFGSSRKREFFCRPMSLSIDGTYNIHPKTIKKFHLQQTTE